MILKIRYHHHNCIRKNQKVCIFIFLYRRKTILISYIIHQLFTLDLHAFALTPANNYILYQKTYPPMQKT